jgi:hypothetical protein
VQLVVENVSMPSEIEAVFATLSGKLVSGVLLAGDLLLGSMLRHARQRLKRFLDLLPRYLLPRSTMR